MNVLRWNGDCITFWGGRLHPAEAEAIRIARRDAQEITDEQIEAEAADAARYNTISRAMDTE